MEFRKWLPLIALVIAVFAFNVSEFMPMGILREIAVDLGRSEADISRIITAYAWAVALLSLPLMLAFRKMDCKKLLLGAILFYAVFQLMSGLSTSYWMLMISRMLSAQGHALFWALAVAVSVRIVDKEHYRFAISMVAVGTSVALIMGVPVGRMLGLAFGWQTPFIVIQAVLFAAGIAVACTFPALPGSGKFSMGVLPRLLRNRAAALIFVVLVVFITGIYTMYSFIEPYLADGVHLSDTWITVYLVVFGLQGVVQGTLISRSKVSRPFLILFSLGGGTVSMFLLYLQQDYGFTVIVPIILWGVCISAFNIVFEGQLLAVVDKEADTVSMALFSALYNVGISFGAILGAAAFGYSVSAVPAVSAQFTLQAFVIAAVLLIPKLRSLPPDAGA